MFLVSVYAQQNNFFPSLLQLQPYHAHKGTMVLHVIICFL
uniref:Uncharacterized protein n=1 Tax=Arundo donax TaxID=35708 RepID=A0A0A9QZV2_ARUDO